jgi:hypothetical protein
VLYIVTGILSAGALMVSGVGRFPIIAVLGLLLALLAVGARRTGLLVPPPAGTAGAGGVRGSPPAPEVLAAPRACAPEPGTPAASGPGVADQ